MRISTTLSVYIGREFLLATGLVMFALLALIMVIDFVELARRAAGKEHASLIVLIQMLLLHAPYLMQRVLPFAVLVGVMLALSRLTRSSELAVVRSAGVSVWQFLFPGLVLAAGIGIVATTVFNPLAAAMLSRYEQMDAKYITETSGELAVLTSGLWLRQVDATGESVVHATRVSQPDLALENVIIFMFDQSDRFIRRVDAESAQLQEGHWLLDDALVTAPEKPAQRVDSYRLKTDLTVSRIQESFAEPSTLSFWALPGFIGTLKAAGFSALQHEVHFHNLLAAPFLLCGALLVAAAFSLRLPRRGGTGLLFSGGLLTGFILYFFSDVVVALGLSGRIPVELAAWSPSAVTILLGLGTLLHFEEG